MNNIELKIKTLVEQKSDCTVNSMHQDLRNDLELDSLDTIELFMDIDREFGIEIPDETWDQANVSTVSDISDVVTQFISNP